MDKNQINEFLVLKIQSYCEENDIKIGTLTNNTRLMGSGGLFDSLDLVNFIVELEEGLEDEFDLEITLTDEKAMSRRTSPFINSETLTTFIFEQANE